MPERLGVLCVDDDEDALFIASLSLGLDPDIWIMPARSGASAIEILESSEAKFSCMLIEERMAGMSGSALLAAIKKHSDHRDLPVAFLTASVSEAEKARYMALGAIGIIAKPYDPVALAAQVRDFLDSTTTSAADHI